MNTVLSVIIMVVEFNICCMHLKKILKKYYLFKLLSIICFQKPIYSGAFQSDLKTAFPFATLRSIWQRSITLSVFKTFPDYQGLSKLFLQKMLKMGFRNSWNFTKIIWLIFNHWHDSWCFLLKLVTLKCYIYLVDIVLYGLKSCKHILNTLQIKTEFNNRNNINQWLKNTFCQNYQTCFECKNKSNLCLHFAVWVCTSMVIIT